MAGASGTAANLMLLAKLLGLTPAQLAELRTAMLAWMLPTDDHSWLEIMLGADSVVTAAERIQLTRRAPMGETHALLADFDRTLPEHRADSWAAALAPVMAWLRTREAYDAELRAFGAADPGGGLPLPSDEASHPYGTPGFMGLPRRLCALQVGALQTDGRTISCTKNGRTP